MLARPGKQYETMPNSHKRNGDHLSPPINEVQKRYQWEPNNILSENPFYLPPHLEPSSSDNDQAGTSDTTKLNKIPPIFLHGKYNHKEIISDIKKIASGEFTTSYTTKSLKISLTSEDDYRKLSKHYLNNEIPFHTYHNPNSKPLSVVLKNVPPSLTIDDIKEELTEYDLPIQKISRLFYKDKTPMLVCAVELTANEKAEEIYKINKLQNSIISVEPRRLAKHTPQCHRCQRTGHTKNYCTLPPRCVKCAGDHLYTNCTKRKEEPPTCVNCHEQHPANYRGCSYHQSSVKTRAVKKSYQPPTEAPHTTASRTAESSTRQTYAERTRQASVSDSTSFLNNILTTLLNFIKPFIQDIKNFLITNLLPIFINGP